MWHFSLTSEPRDRDWAHLLESYRRVVSPTATVLELGASVPHLTRQLSADCQRLIGVGPARLRDFGNVTYRVGDWQSLTGVVPPESIDVAVASHTIEHIPDDRRALRELHAVLRPGGVAILNTPNRRRLVRALGDLVLGPQPPSRPDHVREYTEHDLEELIEQSPFMTYHITPVFFGIHSDRIHIGTTSFPHALRPWANFLEVQLVK